MPENLHADFVQSRQTLFVRYCPKTTGRNPESWTWQPDSIRLHQRLHHSGEFLSASWTGCCPALWNECARAGGSPHGVPFSTPEGVALIGITLVPLLSGLFG